MSNITIAIGTWSETYQAYLTSAPRAYDYGYCIPIYGNDNPEKDSSRVVLIPVDRAEYQRGRYASGLYGSEVCNWGLDITEILYKRLKPEEKC